MTIQDLSNNLFVTASSPMIGFLEAAAEKRPLTLQIYRFLIEGIREEDQTNGAQFVERFLNGPQQAWETTDAAIRALPDMWSVVQAEDRFLPYLKWIVGWTSELDYITDDLDSTTLRRLIAASVPFWRIRGSEEGLADILRLTTAARLRIWDWFDLRYIVDEIGIGEEAQGHDPWMINLPGAPDDEERTINVRIVDDGMLNHRLVRNLAKLSRPSGERIVINYLGMLDLFDTDDDSSQWDDVPGVPIPLVRPTVADGIMTIPGQTGSTACYVRSNPASALSWRNYVVSARVRGQISALEVYQSEYGESYFVYIYPAAQAIAVFNFVAGSPTPLFQVNPYVEMGGLILQPDVFYMLRVAVSAEAGQTRITVWLDGNFVGTALDASHTQGAIALPSSLFSPYPMEISEVEMFFSPLEEEIVTGA